MRLIALVPCEPWRVERVCQSSAIQSPARPVRAQPAVQAPSAPATPAYGYCNPMAAAGFTSKGWGSNGVSIMVRKIAIGLAAAALVTGALTLSASALPGGGTLGAANSGGDGLTAACVSRGGHARLAPLASAGRW
jgi:hypothetical protein